MFDLSIWLIKDGENNINIIKNNDSLTEKRGKIILVFYGFSTILVYQQY